MTEAAIGIAVFLEDRTAYDKAVTKFRGRVPAYIYIAADGALPKAAPGSGLDTRDEIINYWQGQSTFMDGLSQETCRDLTHTGYGISAISHIAETSRIQGQDLYPEIAERLRHALGLQAKYQLGAAVAVNAVRRHAQGRPRPDHRGRIQRPAQPDGHRHDQHPDPHRAAAAGRIQQPLRRLGDPDPRGKLELMPGLMRVGCRPDPERPAVGPQSVRELSTGVVRRSASVRIPMRSAGNAGPAAGSFGQSVRSRSRCVGGVGMLG